MNRRCLFVVVYFANLMSSASAVAANYVGLVYPPLPSECTSSGGMLIDADTNSGFTDATCSGEALLWVVQRAEPTAPPSVRPTLWKVTSVTSVGRLNADQSLLNSHSGCVVSDEPNRFVVAVVRWDSAKQEATHVLAAWMFIATEGHFAEVDVTKVSCGYSEDRD